MIASRQFFVSILRDFRSPLHATKKKNQFFCKRIQKMLRLPMNTCQYQTERFPHRNRLIQSCKIGCVKRRKIEKFLIQYILRIVPKQAGPLHFTQPVWTSQYAICCTSRLTALTTVAVIGNASIFGFCNTSRVNFDAWNGNLDKSSSDTLNPTASYRVS